MKWYDEINQELKEREKRCKSVGGVQSVYSVPSNAFTSRSKKQFEEKHPFKATQCRPAKAASLQDENKRFYQTVTNAGDCKQSKGIWDEKQPNRASRFVQGTCWTNVEDAACSLHSIPQLIRKEAMGANKLQIYQDAVNNCDADPMCAWKENDCVRTELGDKASHTAPKPKRGGPIEMPADDMPLDITKTEANIEQFLYDWYTNGEAPQTKPLFGEGDRCNANATPDKKEESQIEDDDGPIDPYKTKEYQKYITDFATAIKISNQLDFKAFLESINFSDIRHAMQVINGMNPKARIELKKEIEEEYLIHIDHLNLARSYNAPSAPSPPAKSTGFLPSLPQSVVNMVMKHIATKNSTNRGMMALHSTGSGKTCTAAGVMDAFWDTDRQIIFASSIDAVASNPPFKFHECAMRLFPRFSRISKSKKETARLFEERGIIYLPFARLANRIVKGEKFKQLIKTAKPSSTLPSGLMTHLLERIKKNYPKYGERTIYAALKEAGIQKPEDFVDLDHACLIVDEVHNLFRPLATQKEKHMLVEKHIVDPSMHPNLKVVILSATPGDNVADVVKLLNIVRDPTHAPILPPNVEDPASIQKFRNSIRGMISYFDMSYDTTQFPTVKEQALIKLPMSKKQFDRYLEAYNEVKESMKDYNKLAKANQLNKYWQGARKYANMLYNFDKGMQLTEFSSKLPALLERIKEYPKEKHYVYSSFYEARGSSQGILEIARQLEAMGYQKLTVKEAKELNKRGALPPPGKRYLLALQKEIGEEGSSSAGMNLDELIKIYNHKENKNGALVNVFLATQGFNEGIDLKAVRHIHFFEPLVTMASDLQTVGRARRYCSHADLDRSANEWSVMVHRYIADVPIKTSFADLGKLQQEVDASKQQVNDLATRFESMDKKDPEYAATKQILSERKKQLKEQESNLKRAAKEETSKVNSIDEFIYNNAKEKMKELFTVHMAIKEAAVDCRLLTKFHNELSPTPFQCVGDPSTPPDTTTTPEEATPIKPQDDLGELPRINTVTESYDRLMEIVSKDGIDLSGMDNVKIVKLIRDLRPILDLPEDRSKSMGEIVDYVFGLTPDQFGDVRTTVFNTTKLADAKARSGSTEFGRVFRYLFAPQKQVTLVKMAITLAMLGDWDSAMLRHVLEKYIALYEATFEFVGKKSISEQEAQSYKKIAQELSRLFATPSNLFMKKYTKSLTFEQAWAKIAKRFKNIDDPALSEYKPE